MSNTLYCGDSDVQLSFMESQIKVRPTQVNLRKTRGKLNHVRCRVSREAGQHIYDHHRPGEVVYVISTGKELGRFYIPDEDGSVEVTEKSAFVELKDEIQILDETIIDKTFGGYNNLGDVVEWLVKASIDEQEYDVISDYGFTTPQDADIETFTNYLKDDIFGKRYLSYASAYTDPMFDLLNVERFDLDYQNVSVLSALNDIANKMEMSIFGRGNGTIWIGNEEHEKNVFAAGFGNDKLNITGISLPQNVTKINEVRIIGGTGVDLKDREGLSSGKDYEFQSYAAVLKNNALKESEGKKIKLQIPEIKSAKALANIAKRVYVRETQNESNGTVSVDVLSSVENQGVNNFKDVDVGDAIYIEESDYCRQRNIPSGLYNISGLHHKINNRVGWNTTLEISQVPLMDNVSVMFYPLNREGFSDLERLINDGWTKYFIGGIEVGE